MRCYICGREATVRVTVTKMSGPHTRYLACDDHEPRHIPGGDVVSISSVPIR